MQAVAWLEAGVGVTGKVTEGWPGGLRLDQIARDREEYFSGHGESPGNKASETKTASPLTCGFWCPWQDSNLQPAV
jgi:hypothetical protein